jgi:geranylgeranyl diphosphate synthase type II
VNLALLVGDVLVGSAYERLLKGARGHHRELAALFTQGLIDVCDGQALDLENERRKDVTVAQYFRMIEKKTGALLGMSAELGGIIGGGTPRQQRALRVFGRCLGRAFQLQDDLLDVVADPADFGKTIGGDIIGRKKTFLLLTAVRKAAGGDRRLLESVLRKGNSSRPWRKRTGALTEAGRETVAAVAALYERCGALDDARRLIRRNTDEALRSLSRLPDTVARSMLVQLAEDLTTRVS